MDFKMKLEKPDPSRAWISAGVMGMSYFLGGIIPMIPYFVVKNVTSALFFSIAITIVILLGFGYVKSIITGTGQKSAFYSAFQTLIIGALAAGASYGIVRGVNAASGGAAEPTQKSTNQMGGSAMPAMVPTMTAASFATMPANGALPTMTAFTG